MGFGRYRFRRSFGQVKAQFRGARPKFYPLFTGLLDTYAGAAAAYSLRRLSKIASSVVRVRRASDNAEKDFTADNITDGAMVNWVNGQIVPPLDIRELDANGERTGALVEAAAAYSLRNLSDSYAGDVVEVRRNTDGSTQDFNAVEVSDNTLTDWVNTSFADDLPLDTSSGAAAAYSLRNLSSSFTGSVVEVRRSSDDAEDSFTASDVSDGTLEDWVTEDITLIDETSFPVDSGGFESTISGSTFTYGETLDGKTDVLYSTFDGGGLQGLNFASTTTIAEGDTVTYSFVVYWPSDNTGTLPALTIRSGNTAIGHSEQSIPSADNWHTISGSFVATQDATSLTLYVTSSTGRVVGDTLAIASGSYVVTSASGFVSKWYDQSGNANHATQGANASQPKIVDAGALVSGGLDFDGVDDNFNLSSLTLSGGFSTFSYSHIDSDSGAIFGYTSNSNYMRCTSSALNFRINGTNNDYLFSDVGNGLISTTRNSSDEIRSYLNGAESSTGELTEAGDYLISRIGARNSALNPANGTIQEIIIYNSDQSDKRRAIEENIGDHYGITLASFSNDGFVKTWYDQSGNTNHATQGTDAKQPKIVDAGSLVSGGINFDGVNDTLDLPAVISSINSASSFTVARTTNASATQSASALSRNAPELARFYAPIATSGNFYFGYGANTTAINLGSSDTDEHLFTGIAGSSTAEGFIDGTSGGTVSSVDLYSQQASGGIGSINSTTHWNGTISEIIIYPSDQSDNRTAIEANIGDHYDIDLPSGVDTGYDQVDGFVETWYDQSGNGNDAVQQVSGSQPKIVDAGVLVSDGIEFDGVDDRLTCSSLYSSDISVFNVATTSNTVNTGNYMRMIHLCDGSDSFQLTRGGSVDIGELMSKNTSFQSGTISFKHGYINGLNLISAITSSTNTDAYVDSSLQSNFTDVLGAGNSTPTTIGARDDLLSSSFFAGSYAEIIIYNSDQSANRAAIETNINDHYDIYA